MEGVRIVPTEERYIPGFRSAVDAVARERRYLGLVEGPALEEAAAFVHCLLDGGGVQLLAVDSRDSVVGWCDIVRTQREGFRHVGRLGMGVLAAHRRSGLGRRLAVAAIDAAHGAGIERIELEVFLSNRAAISLYESLGFVTEGTKLRVRKLDGVYDDDVIMALIRPGG